MKRDPEEIPDAEHELVLNRVCAIDVAKASGKVSPNRSAPRGLSPPKWHSNKESPASPWKPSCPNSAWRASPLERPSATCVGNCSGAEILWAWRIRPTARPIYDYVQPPSDKHKHWRNTMGNSSLVVRAGAGCFGIVVGYAVYRSLARSGPTSSVSGRRGNRSDWRRRRHHCLRPNQIRRLWLLQYGTACRHGALSIIWADRKMTQGDRHGEATQA